MPVEDAGGSGFSKMPFDVRCRIADDKFKAKRILKELRGLDDTAAGRCSRACRGSSTYAFLFLLASSSCISFAKAIDEVQLRGGASSEKNGEHDQKLLRKTKGGPRRRGSTVTMQARGRLPARAGTTGAA